MNGTQCSGTRLFVDQARDNFGDVGAVAPSSPSLARAMVAPLDRYRLPRTVLEVGAGTGAVTAALIDRLAPGDRLDVVESNAAFARALQTVTEASTMTTRPQTTVHTTRIEAFQSAVRYDVIVSGLPFTNFAPDEVGVILDSYDALLTDGGSIVYFAYVGTRRLRSVTASRNEARRHLAVEKLLSDYRGRFDTSLATVWCNLPPARVWDLRRKRRLASRRKSTGCRPE
ncbi:methyltransferase domain-containing protein [Rhodococcus sp. IEGM 1379]|uniref:class I SAM-dependent methyltransferase n=1 Tax=Rhodococcus sp. IEGM 1379 TaxID=3047086 RepID=UPI0024B7D0B7|nr:methyltransferase domain-containing protein [Rhodococcus sp. IEGM 1379]MDI9917309.1 methyltransferase domain-containing protein [Rhodococcus sp. IEGM 1379]